MDVQNPTCNSWNVQKLRSVPPSTNVFVPCVDPSSAAKTGAVEPRIIVAANAQAKFKVEAVNPLETAATADSKKYAAEVFAEMINLGVAPEDITIVSRAGSDVKTPLVNVYAK